MSDVAATPPKSFHSNKTRCSPMGISKDTSKGDTDVSPKVPVKQPSPGFAPQMFCPLMDMKLSANIEPIPSGVEESLAKSPSAKSRDTNRAANTAASAGFVTGPELNCGTASHNLMVPTGTTTMLIGSLIMLLPFESEICRVNVASPAVVGVPLMIPDDAMLRPNGRAPESMETDYGGVPRTTASD